MGVRKEIWQNTIVEGLFADNSFMSKATNDDVYVNEGKKVHIPNAGSPSTVVVNRDTIPAAVSKRTDTDVEYELDELTTDPVVIPHADTVELSYDKRNSVISQDREKLIQVAAQNMLYKWNPGSARSVKTSGTAVAAHTTDATGNRKAFTKADVLALMAKFDQEDIPQEGRYLLLDAVMYTELLDSLTATDQIGFFQAADVKKGVIGNLFGFNVMKRSQVLRFKTDGSLSKFDEKGVATDNAAALAWHEGSVSRALGDVKMFDSVDNPAYYGDIYSFLVRCGGAIRRSNKAGVWLVIQAPAA